ncbi:MAG: alpha/beta hydrolase [Betaproteobacteria bacterium]|nr:alpha/beta hydrolase [Betaproteobacteria bacterium]
MTDSTAAPAPAWTEDPQLPGYECTRFEFPPDYDGPVIATLVRKAGAPRKQRAVLYVHGFIDYFFQAHMAERFAAEGWSFYALDLRKHGRSLLPDQHACFCKRIDEYFADITRAIDLIATQAEGPLLLAGHSTGGLIASLYADGGERKARISMLWLNSPFFQFKAPAAGRFLLGVAAATGIFFPYLTDPNGLPPDYAMSLHKHHAGEWDFDLRLKPIEGFPLYYGWVGAILAAHHKVQAGLSILCPVLVMHSDASDIVLEWQAIVRWSPGLGHAVTLQQFPGALHDLMLSPEAIRAAVFEALFVWLSRAR